MRSVSENLKRSNTVGTASGDTIREHKTGRCMRTADTGFIPSDGDVDFVASLRLPRASL